MTTPDYMPVLSWGAHDHPRAGACFMEMESFLAGEEFSDSPACAHPVLTRVARSVNDELEDDERHRLVPLLGRTIGTASDDPDLAGDLLAWSGRQGYKLRDPVAFLTGLFNEYDRLTGRTEAREVTADDYAALVALTA